MDIKDAKTSTRCVGRRIDLSRHLPFRLSQASRMLSIGASRMLQKQFGLGVREWRIIAILGDAGAVTAADMVGPAAFDKATVSRAIYTLEQRGLIERAPDPEDGRKQLVVLTAAGVDLHDRVVPVSRMRARVVESALTPQEREQFIGMLDKLTAQIQWLSEEERDEDAQNGTGDDT